ncbi:putative methyltransferase-domain-containing protein [Sphaerosporella brunnea]|uniref:Protein N-terminal and lysine N-methyltransferase EFM7 n=1 Tax=Sphaerosporella brunnea TaxID=1250544 RepID=A0A5J5F5Y1_9PEZI|nr:putative methyltransferase-domain-containing protein [Sphaerosporella brunnea]
MFDDSDSEEPLPLLPDEPEDFLPPPPPATTITHALTTVPYETLTLRLVGHNPLWGHHLWNAGLVISKYLETNAARLVQGKRVLELGAGAGLPSLTCALRGAAEVVVTDYPDAPLIDNLRINISSLPTRSSTSPITAEGYLWGNTLAESMATPFDVVILSDLLFNHSEHAKLLKTVQLTLRKSRDARALVFFTPHRPWLLEKDLEFLKNAETELEGRFTVEKVLETLLERPMFEEDKGDRDLRRTVYGYELSWADLAK